MTPHLTIDDVTQRTGLTAHTLRYYERIGLIAPVGRAAGGQRRYAAADMEWIEFLLRLRTTRMPIGMMQSFAALRAAGDATVPARRSCSKSTWRTRSQRWKRCARRRKPYRRRLRTTRTSRKQSPRKPPP